MTKTTVAQAYKEINSLLEKHKDLIVYPVDCLIHDSKKHLFGVSLRDEYGLSIDPKTIYSLDYNRFGEFMSISYFGEKYKRLISWSETKEQPDNELLLCIYFPSGPFLFGKDYPIDLFKSLINELRTYNPRYLDIVNHCLYFTMENASDVFNSFNDILKKYQDLNNKDSKIREIEKLKKELNELQNGL